MWLLLSLRQLIPEKQLSYFIRATKGEPAVHYSDFSEADDYIFFYIIFDDIFVDIFLFP